MEWFLKDPDETELAGALLARCVEVGSGVALEGDLGAGKTHFTRGLVRGFWQDYASIPDAATVSSPTYTLIQRYPLPDGVGHVLHADLYRLEDADDLESTGYWDEVDQAAVWVVEWIDRIPEAFPGEGFHVCLAHREEGRALRVEWRGGSTRDWTRVREVLDTHFERLSAS